MEVDESDNSAIEAPLIFYQNSLRILRARRLNYEAGEERDKYKRDNGADASYDDVLQSVQNMQKSIFFSTIVKEALQTITNTEEMLGNPEPYESLLQYVTLVCQEINNMKVPTSQEMYRERLEYCKFLGSYWQSFIAKMGVVQRKRTKPNSTTLTKLEKSEKYLKKVNLIRVMKRVMIGTFFNNSSKYPQVSSFQTAMRREMTVHDFTDGSNLGFEPANLS